MINMERLRVCQDFWRLQPAPALANKPMLLPARARSRALFLKTCIHIAIGLPHYLCTIYFKPRQQAPEQQPSRALAVQRASDAHRLANYEQW
jgi:hypothetical protein